MDSIYAVGDTAPPYIAVLHYAARDSLHCSLEHKKTLLGCYCGMVFFVGCYIGRTQDSTLIPKLEHDFLDYEEVPCMHRIEAAPENKGFHSSCSTSLEKISFIFSIP